MSTDNSNPSFSEIISDHSSHSARGRRDCFAACVALNKKVKSDLVAENSRNLTNWRQFCDIVYNAALAIPSFESSTFVWDGSCLLYKGVNARECYPDSPDAARQALIDATFLIHMATDALHHRAALVVAIRDELWTDGVPF